MDPTTPEARTQTDLLQKKQEIQTALHRARLAIITILAVVVGLAMVALAGVYWAGQNLEQAESATRVARERLYHSYLSQARAERISKTLGSKDRALQALSLAAEIHPSAELANEALHVLAVTGIDRETVYWPTVPGVLGVDSDRAMNLFVRRFNNGHVVVHRWKDNSELLRITNSAAAVTAEFSADGTLLAIRCEDDSISIWDLEKKAQRFTKKLENPGSQGIYSLSLSADGKMLAVGEFASKKVRFYSTVDGHEELSIGLPEVETLAFSPAEANLIAVLPRGRRVQIWDISNKVKISEKEGPADLVSISFSGSGTRLVAGSTSGDILVWNVPENTSYTIRAHEGFAIAKTDPHGKLIATSGWDGSTRFWNADTGQHLLTTREGLAVNFTSDGKELIYQKEGGAVGAWKVAPSEILRTFYCGGPGTMTIFGLDLDSSGELLGIMRADGVRLFDAQTGEKKGHLLLENQWAQDLSFSRRGQGIYGASRKGFHQWNFTSESGALKFETERSLRSPEGWEGGPVIVSLDESLAVMTISSGGLQVIDLTNWLSKAFPVPAGIRKTSLHPSKESIAINTLQDGTLLVDLNGKLLRRIHEKSGKGEFSPGGHYYALVHNEEFLLFSVPDWKVMHRRPVYLAGVGSGLCSFSRDGRLVAFTQSDAQVVVLSLPKGDEHAVLEYPHLGNMNVLAFDATGQCLYIGTQSEDLVHKWDFSAGKQQAESVARVGQAATTNAAVLAQGGTGTSFWRVLLLILLAVVLTVLLAIVFYRRHGRLLQEYTRTEEALLAQGQELRQVQSELLHSQKMTALGTLAAGIAHDFNNLLQVIRLSNDLIAEAESKREIIENVQEIQSAVQQGRDVIRSLLGYVRADTGERESFQPADMIQHLVDLLRRRFFNGVEIKVEAHPGLPPAYGSPVRFEQMMLNIFINAAEALGEHGKLLITLSPCRQPIACKLAPRDATGYIQITVSDNGPGIRRDHLDRIFEPFFTTKNAGANRGTGLGLTLVFSLAQKEGIGLSVNSVAGQGTQFSLFVPAAEIAPEQSTKRAHPAQAAEAVSV